MKRMSIRFVAAAFHHGMVDAAVLGVRIAQTDLSPELRAVVEARAARRVSAGA